MKLTHRLEIPPSLQFLKEYWEAHRRWLVKLGGFKDGSYVADYYAVIQSKYLVSGGVGSNVRFESDFRDLQPNVHMVLVDPTVSVLRMIARGLYHFGRRQQSGYRSLSEVLNYLYLRKHFSLIPKYLGQHFLISGLAQNMGAEITAKQIFLKLDIEGAEYALLDDIVSIKEGLTGLCIEFHDLDLPSHREQLHRFLALLQFDLIHVSVNEVCLNPGGFPSILELSLAPPAQEQVHGGALTANTDIHERYLQSANALDGETYYLGWGVNSPKCI